MLHIGLNKDILGQYPDNHFHSMVTDPPYAYRFMGKKWDYELPSVDDFTEMLRVLRPGAYALVACGTRTQHRMAVNLEDAGFRIVDVISWIYGSGFPKSMNIGKALDKKIGNDREVIGEKKLWGHNAGSGAGSFSKNEYEGQTGIVRTEPLTVGNSEWEGWGTQLKPACEFWTLCQKPISEKTIVDNVLKWGVGGINIDECRTEHSEEVKHTQRQGRHNAGVLTEDSCGFDNTKNTIASADPKGRFPTNLIHDGSEEVLGFFPDAKGQQGDLINHTREIESPNGIYGKQPPRYDALKREESETSAARFFYAAKASKKEREAGLSSEGSARVNNHPTVKPIALMRYLCRLITPRGGTVLDPYAGSGSTGCAAEVEGFSYVLIEQDKQWEPVILGRTSFYKEQRA